MMQSHLRLDAMKHIRIPAVVRKVYPLTVLLDLHSLARSHLRHTNVSPNLTDERNIQESSQMSENRQNPAGR
jgi:hypothetical protein